MHRLLQGSRARERKRSTRLDRRTAFRNADAGKTDEERKNVSQQTLAKVSSSGHYPGMVMVVDLSKKKKKGCDEGKEEEKGFLLFCGWVVFSVCPFPHPGNK